MPSLPVRLLGAWFGLFALAEATVFGLLLGTLTLPPFLLVPRGRRERWTMIPAVWWSRAVVRWLLWTYDEVDGEPVPAGEGAVILCNHRSWLDPLLLMYHTRSNGLSKAEIRWLPVLGLYGWLAGAVYFDRRSKADRAAARQEVRKLVAGGHRLQVFPEGTRTRDGELADRVYLNVPMDCFRDGLPVTCCAVWGTERVLPATLFAAFPGQRVRLRIGRTLQPADFPDARTFAAACWGEVVSLVAGLRREEERCPERDSNPHSASGRGF